GLRLPGAELPRSGERADQRVVGEIAEDRYEPRGRGLRVAVREQRLAELGPPVRIDRGRRRRSDLLERRDRLLELGRAAQHERVANSPPPARRLELHRGLELLAR